MEAGDVWAEERGFCSRQRDTAQADEEDRLHASAAINLKSKWAISPYLVPLKEKLVLAASSALPS